jgi:hypothetical protein
MPEWFYLKINTITFNAQSQCSIYSGFLKPPDNNNKITTNNLVSQSSRRISLVTTTTNSSTPRETSSRYSKIQATVY